jgi:hypothetical protein
MSKVDLSPFEDLVHPNLRTGFHVYACYPTGKTSDLRPAIAKHMIGLSSNSMNFRDKGDTTYFAVGFPHQDKADAFVKALENTAGITIVPTAFGS